MYDIKRIDAYTICHDCALVTEYGEEVLDGMQYEEGERAGRRRYNYICNSLDDIAGNGQLSVEGVANEWSDEPCDCCGTYEEGVRHVLNVLHI